MSNNLELGKSPRALTVDSNSNLVVTAQLETSTIDTSDSSALTITPDVVMSAGLTVGNHIVPSSNENIDLGSTSFRFRDLYLSGQSIDLGGVQITKSGSAIALPAGSTIGGVQPTSYADNEKATFGTSNDLEIFHDGSHSYITDTGTGQLRLRASAAMVFQNAGGTQGYATFNENGAVQLYYNGGEKFATTSTGADVTGNLVVSGQLETSTIDTSDSSAVTVTPAAVFSSDVTIENDLTLNGKVLGDFNVDSGDIRIQGTIPEILFRSPDGTSNQYYIGANISDGVDGGFIIGEGSGITGGTPRVAIDASGNVGIGTTSPAVDLDVVDTMRLSTSTTNYGQLAGLSGALYIGHRNAASDGAIIFGGYGGGSFNEHMRLAPTGNFGIGNSSPSTTLDVTGDITASGSLFVPIIDTADSSALTVTPATVFSSDVTVENDLVVTNKVTAVDVTASGTVSDSISDVRTPRYTNHSGGDLTVSDEGVYMIIASATLTTLTLGTPVAGSIICVYNNKVSSITLACGSQVDSMRKGADNNNTHNATLTLGARSLTTITLISSTQAVVTGTDVA